MSSASMSTSVEHPRLNRTDSSSIRTFLMAYDQYVKEVKERAQQLLGKDTVTTEAVKPVTIKFCVDPEWLQSTIALGFMDDVTKYEDLDDEKLRSYLDKKSEESKESVSLESLNEIVQNELKMDMMDSNARSRIENLIIKYHVILRRNGLGWLMEANQRITVNHVLSAIRPHSLRHRLESDLNFAHHNLRDDFKLFIAHAVKLSEAFQIVDNGPKRISNITTTPKKENSAHKTYKKQHSEEAKEKKTRQLPVCLFLPCKSHGRRHMLRDCGFSTDEEKSEARKAWIEERAKTGPSRSTRSRYQSSNAQDQKPTVGRLNRSIKVSDTPSFSIDIADGNESMTCTGRADDGSDESIVSPRFAEKAVLNGIGRFKKIKPVNIQVALKEGETAETFSFSRTWTPPRTILRLSAGPLALVNVTYLVADAELAVEDLLLGLPILQHLGVDTRSLLEQQRGVLDGTDCSAIDNTADSKKGGHISRLMIARMNRVANEKTVLNAKKNRTSENRPRVNYYKARAEVDPFPDSSLLDPVDSAQHEEIQGAMDAMIMKANENDIPSDDAQALKNMVLDHSDIFRTAFSSGPPASVEPLKVDLLPDAKPVRVRLRNYTQEQREFLKDMVFNLVENKMAYPNPTSPWACAPLLVPKPGPARFRFTVDLRPINRYTVKHQYPMPIVEQELSKLSSSKFYATFDLSHGYWQLPLHPDSQESQSFITPDGIFTPTRVLHGTTNAVTYLQSTLSSIIPESLRPSLISWLDDILLHAETPKLLLHAVKQLFNVCMEYNLKLHPLKCTLFATSIRWCGRIVSSEGVRFDPRRLDGILNMTPPTRGSHLQQFVCALQWLRNAIPNFSAIIRQLLGFLEKVYHTAGKRTRRAVHKVSLKDIGWSSVEDGEFERCKKALAHQVTLVHRDNTKKLAVYTDASDLVWSGIVTQVPKADIGKEHAKQHHEPLAFLSGHFVGAQCSWSILEKEAYAVMATVERMHWILATPNGFDLYTDHHNLIFLFDPLSVMPDLSQSSVRKVLRWAVKLSMYNYTCIHIKGTDNVWADLLGRWSVPLTIRRLVEIPILPSSSATQFEWPSLDFIQNEQAIHKDDRPPNLINENNVWCNPLGAVWIPNNCTELQLRLCVIAHTGPGGHRGAHSTETTMRKSFFWETMTQDVRTFVKACIHCISTVGGGKVPRPFGPAVHGTNANDLLQFDYIEIAPSSNGDKYILMLRDDHSDYKWFFAFDDTSATNAATAIIDWSAAFGVPKGLMSDGPTHFKNETVRLVCKNLKVPHHFTLPYTPWSNGGIERLGKELLRTFRAIISELQLQPGEWPDLLPLVQSVLNNAPSPQRKHVAPITAFTGLKSSTPISTFIRSSTTKPMNINDIQRERAINLKKLQDYISKLHPMVQNTLQHNRDLKRKASSIGELPRFQEGDFVLVARRDFAAGEKLSLRWRGPRRIIKSLNDYVYVVEDLRNGSIEDIHGTRLKFYMDSSLDTVAIMSHVISSETGMSVQRLMKLVKSSHGFNVQVRWKGLDKSEDTLEPLQNVYEDVPQLLMKLLERKQTPAHLAQEARRFLRL